MQEEHFDNPNDFGARLNKELEAITWADRNDLLVRIGKMVAQMKSYGVDRPEWRGPIPEEQMLGADVVIPTDQGERRGRVIFFGVLPAGTGAWERSVVVHVPASGTQHESPASASRLASLEEAERIQREMGMAGRLREAADAVERGRQAALDPNREKQRRRNFKDPRLIESLMERARASAAMVTDSPTNYKLTCKQNDRRIYVFKSQLRVDISGFSVSHPGIRTLTEEEARDMHLGKVRGQLLFDDRAQTLAGFDMALEELSK